MNPKVVILPTVTQRRHICVVRSPDVRNMYHYFQELVLTASGDGTAHIWQCAVHLTNESSSGRMASSEDELDPLERESNQAFGTYVSSLRLTYLTKKTIQR